LNWGGAILPGILNSLIDLIMPQQHPQQEQEVDDPSLSISMVQVTRPDASASPLISRSSFFSTSLPRSCLAMERAVRPMLVQFSLGRPQPRPESSSAIRHWHKDTAKWLNRSIYSSK